MIYDAIKRRDSLIASQDDSIRFMAEFTNRRHDSLAHWLRRQIEKRETRLDTIGLIGKAGGGGLTVEAAKTAGEAAAFAAVLAYIENGWKPE